MRSHRCNNFLCGGMPFEIAQISISFSQHVEPALLIIYMQVSPQSVVEQH